MYGILFLAANPAETDPLNLGEEIRNIRRQIRSAAFRETRIEQEWAVRPSDLITYLQEHEPTIVHFSGHGTDVGEIMLQDSAGVSVPVAPDILGDIFRVLKGNIKCVVFNACYTDSQALAISPFVDCVVGMTRAVRDDAAIQFAGAFYEALSNGRTIREAYDLGVSLMRVIERDQGTVPSLIERSPGAADSILVEKPELMCELRIDKAGKPLRSTYDERAFEVRAWIKNVPSETFCVVYQLDEYHGSDEFSTVYPDESYYEIIFDCAFDFEIRVTLWRNNHNGIGLRTRVVDALNRRYEKKPRPSDVKKAISSIRDNID